jgi:hypothetical protein
VRDNTATTILLLFLGITVFFSIIHPYVSQPKNNNSWTSLYFTNISLISNESVKFCFSIECNEKNKENYEYSIFLNDKLYTHDTISLSPGTKKDICTVVANNRTIMKNNKLVIEIILTKKNYVYSIKTKVKI